MSSLERHRGIVVGIDGSPSSTAAIEWAARDAEMRNVPLTMVHVVPPVKTLAEDWSVSWLRIGQKARCSPTMRGCKLTMPANSSRQLVKPPSRPPHPAGPRR